MRNNIFSGHGSSHNYTGVHVGPRGIEPPPEGVRILNNTFYKTGDGGGEWVAVDIGENTADTLVRNNLADFAPAGTMVSGAGTGLMEDHNLVTDSANLLNPEHADFLSKDFRPAATSPAVAAGAEAPVFDDFEGIRRTSATLDLGALIPQP